jgi:signal peptidase I
LEESNTEQEKIAQEKKEQEKKKRSEVLDWILHIGIAVIVGVLIVTFVAQRTIVHDISMEPTLTEGDNLLVEKLGFRFGWLKSGDIIVFKSPDADILLIKRLVAVEGDRVEVKDGKVYVNGEIFLTGLPNEPETPVGDLPEYTDLTVPEGMVYLLGDNRLYSHDSTEFGPVDKKWITGRALFRIFPFDRFGSID